ncbi:MAG: Ribosomal protein L22p/L17e, partial [Verrucomicrobiota bacterium]
KRMTPRARGSGSRILKRTSHIRIVLTDDVAIETRETKKAKRDQQKKTGEGGEKTAAAKRGKKKTAKAAKK